MNMRNVLMMIIFSYAILFHQQPYLVSSDYKSKDTRVVALERYLTAKKSPLVAASKDFVETADAYSLDWRLLPAIAGVESTFETRGNTSDYNPFDYMCRSRPCRFDSFGQAINKVAKTIARGRAYARFQKEGSTLELARVYNYVTPEDWADKVEYFMKQLYESGN